MISKGLQIISLQSRSIERFFLTVGQNNFWNKMPYMAADYETWLKWVSRDFFFLFALYNIKVRLNTLNITHPLTRSLPFLLASSFNIAKMICLRICTENRDAGRRNVKNREGKNLPSLIGIGLGNVIKWCPILKPINLQ